MNGAGCIYREETVTFTSRLALNHIDIHNCPIEHLQEMASVRNRCLLIELHKE